MASHFPRGRYGRPLAPDSTEPRASLEHPDGACPTARDALRRGIELFDAERFFEAHEFFEFVWRSAEVEDEHRPLWKGITQVAVACCHVQRGNAHGALALFARAVRHLRCGPARHEGIDTARLIDLARDLAERVRRRGASPALGFAPFPAHRTPGAAARRG